MKEATSSGVLHVDACAIVPEGGAMAPELLPGDMVFLQCGTPSDGQIAAVEIDGEMALLRVHYSLDGLQLLCDNPDFPPIRIESPEDIRIIGVMVGLVRLIKEKTPADLIHQQASQ